MRETVDYIIFAGMIFMNLSMNHVDVFGGDLSKYKKLENRNDIID